MFTQLLISKRGRDPIVHTFVANWMILVGDLGQLEPIVIVWLSARTFVQWSGSIILSVRHRILVSQSCLFLPKPVYCVGSVSCLSDSMTLLFLSLDHVFNVANVRRNSKCFVPSILGHDKYSTYIAVILNYNHVLLAHVDSLQCAAC
jgi:hypothetical protein